MKMQFPARKIVVKQVQAALGEKIDGDDGRGTWQAIATALPLSPVPRLDAATLRNSTLRNALVARVQRALGNIEDDGHDGQETWAALAQRFDPSLQYACPKPPLITSPLGGYKESVRGRTPNRNGGTNERRGLCLHHASGYFEGTVSWVMKKGTFAGYHVLINTDGERAIMAQDTDQAHHAGKSSFRGRANCNFFLLGLAFIGNTNDGSMRGGAGKNLTTHEVASACEWIRPRMERYGWDLSDITTHQRIAPLRKDDTSESAFRQIMSALVNSI